MILPGAPKTSPRNGSGGNAPWLRWSTFGFVGGLGFLADAAILESLVRFAQWDPLLARAPAIALAGCVTYALNRTLTFRAPGPASFAEAGRYALGLAGSSGLNYAVFAALLLALPGLPPLAALAAASAAAMAASYLWQSKAVFRSPA